MRLCSLLIFILLISFKSVGAGGLFDEFFSRDEMREPIFLGNMKLEDEEQEFKFKFKFKGTYRLFLNGLKVLNDKNLGSKLSISGYFKIVNEDSSLFIRQEFSRDFTVNTIAFSLNILTVNSLDLGEKTFYLYFDDNVDEIKKYYENGVYFSLKRNMLLPLFLD